MSLDLHSYFAWLETRHPEEIVRISKPVSVDQEMTALAIALERQGRSPALVFENVLDLQGKPIGIPVVVNLYGRRRMFAELLGTSFQDVGREVFRRTKTARIPPTVVDSDTAPVHQIVALGDEVDLTSFPAPIHHSADPGPYVSAGSLITWDPESGVDNTALTRGWVYGPRELRVALYPQNHNALNRDRWFERNQPMPVAYWQGHHPLAGLGGQVRLGFPESHWPATGGLLGEPLRLTPSVSLGARYLVPADAEVVIEGYVTPNKVVEEGPFGEFHGYIGEGLPGGEFRVTAVTRRRNAYWQAVMSGHAENSVFGSLVMEGVIYDTVKPHVPSLKQVYVPLAAHRFHAYLQLADPRLGDAREAIMLALPVAWQLKHVFVFDDDVDIFDPDQVQWAFATRSQWDRDVMVFPRVRANRLDPTVEVPNQMTKAGVDCTRPLDRKFAPVSEVASAVADRIRVEDFIAPEDLARIPSAER